MNMEYKVLPFNSFQVNTIVAWDETNEGVIIDAGCMNQTEQKVLSDFIESKGIKPVALLNTHYHIDHILGNKFCLEKWNISPQAHKDSSHFVENAWTYSSMFDIDMEELIAPGSSLEAGDKVEFGTTVLEVIHTPGHAAGSLCFYNRAESIIFVGDVLFRGSIGRTDLPTGDFDLLKKSIFEQLFTLPDNTTVVCGHGPNTTIGVEAKSNPFLM